MTTTPRSKLSIARRAASMLVAFESLTNRTPPTSATGSSACSRPVNPSTARVIAAGVDAGERRRPPRRRARRRPGARPSSRIDDERHQRLASRRGAPDDRCRRRRRCLGEARRSSRTATGAPARRAAIASDARIVGVQRPPSRRRSAARRSAPWPPRTPRRSRDDRDGPGRNSAAPRSTGGTCRSLPAGSCSPRSTWIVSSVESSTCALSARPMFPPTSTRWPPASSIRPVSVVVVDLPFVPVIATTLPRSQREASSSSPITGRRRVAPPRSAAAGRHARTGDDQIGAGEAWTRDVRRARDRRRAPEAILVVEMSARTSVSVTARAAAHEQFRGGNTAARRPTTVTRLPRTENERSTVIGASTSSG